MTIAIPNTTNEVRMGGIYRAYHGTSGNVSTGYNLTLRGSLANSISITSGPVLVSQSFGGKVGPSDYL
jgi:hypothetical protein